VRCGRQHHLRYCDIGANITVIVPRGLQRQQDALGAAGGEGAGGIVTAIDQVNRHANNVFFELHATGEGGGVQAVLHEVQVVRVPEQLLGVVPGIVDIGKHPALCPGHVITLAGLQTIEDVLA
jgi:hypothetical protein